ncbi:hypothetical protein [Pseudooceanicola nitratireducens]|uniref:hypothetical protein n=1 Tax=Pseudooceanicola nitratireducens TaxID=517719 RepID=UPI0023F549E0|nr:hypothetical protein [Pseudooceanicola nitratireducens]
MADTLYGEVRSQHNLFSAWRHVKRSALNSPNPKIKGEAAEFEHEHQKHLRRIQDQLREQRFHFDDVEGTLKDKKKREAAGEKPKANRYCHPPEPCRPTSDPAGPAATGRPRQQGHQYALQLEG